MFGLQPDTTEPVVASWGARAILTHYKGHQNVDIVWNRAQMNTEDPPAAFVKWLNTKLSKWLNPVPRQRSPKISYIDRGGDDVFRYDDGVFHAKACANRSHGYLYIGAWMTQA